MNEILSARKEEQEPSREFEKAIACYPIHLQGSVGEAFQAAEEKDFEKAAKLCCKLLDYKAVREIRMLLGTCYFMQGDMQSAEMVFFDLVQDYPDDEECHIYHGITNHALGRFEETVKELGCLYPLKVYHPFYYTSYGDSLQQIGRLKQSREAFHEEVAFFEKTGVIVSAEMLDGAFPNLLYLDITLGNGKYQDDIKIYYDFLNQTEMTQKMQENLVRNIVYFCSLMSNKWYRPLFLEFINYIKNKGFLTNKDALEVLDSAFATWESYAYHEDRQITALMEAYLTASYERKYTKVNMFMEEDKTRIDVLALSYDWYMCQYAAEHSDEIAYVRDNYPYTYEDNREFLEKVENNAVETAKMVMDELYKYVHDKSREEFTESMYNSYKRACENKMEPAYVYDGMETYRRIQPKVGRNDPCPCGSGKKYKKCCGR